MPIGIMQGRLLDFDENSILDVQVPDEWLKEFTVAASINFDYVELITERVPNKKNPIWSKKQSRTLVKAIEKHSFSSGYLCHNGIMKSGLFMPHVLVELKQLSENLSSVRSKGIILPLFERCLADFQTYDKSQIRSTLELMRNCLSQFDMELLLEYNGSLQEQVSLLDCFGEVVDGIVIDTGNLARLDIDYEHAFSLIGHAVKHIHIKDKDIHGGNVPLGEGTADFQKIFSALRRYNYRGDFTLETPKGGEAKVSALENLNFLKRLIDEQ